MRSGYPVILSFENYGSLAMQLKMDNYSMEMGTVIQWWERATTPLAAMETWSTES